MSHINELIDYIVAIYLIRDGRVLLCNHIKLNMWVPIGGHIELDEQPIQALKREILEETGFKKVQLFTRYSDYLDRNGTQLPCPLFLDHHNFLPKTNHWHTGFIYGGMVLDEIPPVLAENEHKELRWFTWQEIQRLDTNTSVKAYSKYTAEIYEELATDNNQWLTEML